MNHNPIIKWALGIVGALVSSAILAWLTWINGAIVGHGSRLSVLESQTQDVRGDVKELRHESQQINHKLDKVIEHQQRHGKGE